MQAYDDLQNRIELLLDDPANSLEEAAVHEQSVLNTEKRQKLDQLGTAYFPWNEADVLFSHFALETYRNFYDRFDVWR